MIFKPFYRGELSFQICNILLCVKLNENADIQNMSGTARDKVQIS